MHEMSSLITAVIGKVCIMKVNTNAGPRTNHNILRRGGTIPDPCGGRFCIGATRVWEAEATVHLSVCLCVCQSVCLPMCLGNYR